MELKIVFKERKNGLDASLKDRVFSLTYPNTIWPSYPKGVMDALIDNIAHLLTINTPLIAGVKKIVYNTGRPVFKSFFDEVVKKSIPHSVEDYTIGTEEALKSFEEIKYEFLGRNDKDFVFNDEMEFDEKSVNLLSFGKDSLTSTAVCNEIGLSPVAVYINDTVSPPENKLKLSRVGKFSKEFGIKMFIIVNEFEKMNDFEFWGKEETMLGYTHMVTGFCFLALPFIHYFKSGYIVLGNQQDMNFGFVNKDGFVTYPSYDQTTEWMLKQNEMMRKATAGMATVMSVIEPLTNIAITKILHTRYAEFGRYQVSCDCLDASDEKRWCHECNKCARNVLFMKAFGIEPERVGLRNILLDKNNKRLFCLFNGSEVDCYEKSKEAREQQLLAFLMAYENGERGPLIELFKKKFLEEAKEREDELRKRFFSIYKSKTMPRKIERRVTSIYKEELSDFI